MRFRALALLALAVAPLRLLATDFTQTTFSNNTEMVGLAALHTGGFSGLGIDPPGSQFPGIHHRLFSFTAVGGFNSWGGSSDHIEAGAIAFRAGDSWSWVSGGNDNGTGWLAKFSRQNQGGAAGSTSMWHAGGPVHPIADGVSVDVSKNVCALYEVRPTTLATRTALIVTIPLGSLPGKQVHTYALGAGEQILDCAARPDGGLVYLSGTPASAAVNVINADGGRNGPFQVGAASQISYSPLDGGTVFTAGRTGTNAFFTRGPINSTYTESNTVNFSLTNLGFEFGSAYTKPDGTTWWGGSITSLGGDKDGFIAATRNNSSVDFFGCTVAQNASGDQTVRDIYVDPYGKGIWVGEGQIGSFNDTTGTTLERFPAVPNPNVTYKAVEGALNYQAFAYVRSGVVGYDSVLQKSVLVMVDRLREIRDAVPSQPTYVGGSAITLYARMFYYPLANTTFPVAYGSAPVTGAANLTFLQNNLFAQLHLTSQPVATPTDVEVNIGTATNTVTARFTLMPPTPKNFDPPTQTVQGGSNAVTRLWLTGKTPVGGITINLSDNGSELSTDPTMFMAGGLIAKSFLIRTMPVASTVTRTVTATHAGVSKTSDVTIIP